MKFMIVSQFKDSLNALPPEKQKEIWDTSAQFFDKLTKEGTLKEMYYLGNMKGAMAILDLNSAEDLVRITDFLAFPFVTGEVTPLVEIDVVRKVQGKK
ncbi:MAG: hypothetical protein ABSD38_26845 [Syntrophorhabdales bacterium]